MLIEKFVDVAFGLLGARLSKHSIVDLDED